LTAQEFSAHTHSGGRWNR